MISGLRDGRFYLCTDVVLWSSTEVVVDVSGIALKISIQLWIVRIRVIDVVHVMVVVVAVVEARRSDLAVPAIICNANISSGVSCALAVVASAHSMTSIFFMTSS